MRYGIAAQQYFDNNGKPLSGGLLHFYESGTTTDKDTFSDSNETIPNTNPVVLDAAGRQGDIFFSGLAKVVVSDSDGVQIDVTDPVGSASVTGALVDWLVTVEYALGDTVTDGNGNYYVSIVAGNLGHNPSISPTYWQQLLFVYPYNANFTYELGDICITGNKIYVSLVGTNVGNTPATATTSWKPLGLGPWLDTTPKTANFTAEVGRTYLINTNGGAFTMTLPTSPSAGDQVGFIDYGGQFVVNNLTIGRGGQSIMNLGEDMTCNISYVSVILTFTTGRGWILT